VNTPEQDFRNFASGRYDRSDSDLWSGLGSMAQFLAWESQHCGCGNCTPFQPGCLDIGGVMQTIA